MNAIFSLDEMENIQFENERIVFCALEVYKSTTFDFVDTLLYSYKKIQKNEVITFDKKLKNRLNDIEA